MPGGSFITNALGIGYEITSRPRYNKIFAWSSNREQSTRYGGPIIYPCKEHMHALLD